MKKLDGRSRGLKWNAAASGKHSDPALLLAKMTFPSHVHHNSNPSQKHGMTRTLCVLGPH